LTKIGHEDSIVSVDVLESNNEIIATCSDDNTIRLWDLRADESIKVYKDPLFVENTPSNVKILPDGSKILAGAGSNILAFDMKTDKILVEESTLHKNCTRDEINCVAISPDGKYTASCDDSHDIQVYNTETLETHASFQDNHTNIPFTLDFMNPGDKPVPYCLSSGFDCMLYFWDLEKKASIKSSNITEICKKNIAGQLISPPLVYNISVRQSTVLVSVQTGHIIALTWKEHKKPKYIIDAHLGKVMRSTFCRFNENIIASASTDLSFALWDVNKRDERGVPNFLRRIAIPEKPNWLETTKTERY